MLPTPERGAHLEQVKALAEVELQKELEAKLARVKPSVITVRMSAEDHGLLLQEATMHRTSLNKLCMAKLRQNLTQTSLAKLAAKKSEDV